MKTILKLVVVAVLANALWHVGSAYTTFYKFKDSIVDAAMQRGSTEEELKQKIVGLADTYDLPLTPDAVTIKRDVHHTEVLASYTKLVAVLPGFEYPWPFNVDVDAYPLEAPPRR